MNSESLRGVEVDGKGKRGSWKVVSVGRLIGWMLCTGGSSALNDVSNPILCSRCAVDLSMITSSKNETTKKSHVMDAFGDVLRLRFFASAGHATHPFFARILFYSTLE